MASSSSSSNKSHQVFINHRGVDVKKTFVRSLYRRLREKGLTAFFNEEEMQGGCEISSQLADAIRTASVHVAIFSPRYVESEWCLNELLLMLKSNGPIVPVFYRVKPQDVRWMLGLYGEALATHEMKGRHDPSTIEEWRNALNEVANKSGFELQKDNSLLWMELLDKVVKRLLEMVQQQDRKPQILGIGGLGGVGKTTLLKAFLYRLLLYVAYTSISCLLPEELPSLETLVSLESLRAEGCKKLKGIRASAQATKVRYLNVSGCSELAELPSLETLVSLEQLWANGCVNLRSIWGLAQATNLRNLSVRKCFALEEVEGIEHCTWLESLDVSPCHELQIGVSGVEVAAVP
uniref:TIR/P-loop/LRR n=1 Tax=Pinus taeda TaxID=3352 RepID=Q8L8J0_PINTA|nr:TIR/P-loop/LRR [Pinus taeda]